MSFDQSVFINCPFDNNYQVLLRPLFFSLLSFDLNPRISETESSAHIRIEEIMRLIKTSKYSIHDISRKKTLKQGDIARFNMPYEMGLDIGCQKFGTGKLKEKKCLIFDSNPHEYDISCSDISGQDIKAHNNDPETLIVKVREWFVRLLNRRLQSAASIWENYTEFVTDMNEQLALEGFSPKEIASLSHSEFIILASNWIKESRK